MALKITHKDNSKITTNSGLEFDSLYISFGLNTPPREYFFYSNLYLYINSTIKTSLQERVSDINMYENIKFDIGAENWNNLNNEVINNILIERFKELNPTYNIVIE